LLIARAGYANRYVHENWRVLMRWSQLQSLIYNVWCDDLRLQIHCTAYPLPGSCDVGRCWITLGKEIIWDVPKDFPEERKRGTYSPVASEITELIHLYLDTARNELMKQVFPEDHWGLVDIFRAADRRLGAKSLEELAQRNLTPPARKVLEERQKRQKTAKSTNKGENITNKD
jgi:hypothetical protein